MSIYKIAKKIIFQCVEMPTKRRLRDSNRGKNKKRRKNKEEKANLLKEVLYIPEFRKFRNGEIGLLYWLCGLLNIYEGEFIRLIERGVVHTEEEEYTDTDFTPHPIWLYTGKPDEADNEIERELLPYVCIENIKRYLVPHIRKGHWSVRCASYLFNRFDIGS